ncbi:hypothetical protein BKG86_00815 [Mycobacteroides chelonae]|nr:hypothetical protein BKG86_00815 [Mycobacteroides chelonae]
MDESVGVVESAVTFDQFEWELWCRAQAPHTIYCPASGEGARSGRGGGMLGFPYRSERGQMVLFRLGTLRHPAEAD